MCLRLTTTKAIEKLNLEFKEKDDIIVEKDRKINELQQVINSAYAKLNSYQIDGMCSTAYYRQIIRQGKDLLEEKVEKKFADEILPHFTSTNH